MSVSIYGILSLGSRPINVKRIVVMRFKLEAHRLFSLVTVLSLVIQDFNHLDGVSWNWAPLNKCEDEGQRSVTRVVGPVKCRCLFLQHYGMYSKINCMLRGINEKKGKNITVAYVDRCILDLGTLL